MADLVIPEEILRQAGLDQREALIEFSCRLFDAGRLSLGSAARLARLNRPEFEAQLLDRNIAIYRPTVADLRQDLATLSDLEI